MYERIFHFFHSVCELVVFALSVCTYNNLALVAVFASISCVCVYALWFPSTEQTNGANPSAKWKDAQVR